MYLVGICGILLTGKILCVFLTIGFRLPIFHKNIEFVIHFFLISGTNRNVSREL